MQQRVVVLGSTGSIGQSTLDVIARHPERYRVYALAALRQIDLLETQIDRFNPAVVVVVDPAAAEQLQTRLRSKGATVDVQTGADALVKLVQSPQIDTVMAAIVGAAGLPSALAAAEAGKRVLLANKEALVMAGPVFMEAVRRSGAVLLPIDSEHNAIFQSLPANYAVNPEENGVSHIVLTASGGPFRGYKKEQLTEVTPEQAVSHPKWSMGPKISVDSASLMNKGLEVIEAHFLFGLPAEKIKVVVHPQSTIHSLVQYVDGSVIAELGEPDMRTPIAHALAWPERIQSGVHVLDLVACGQFDFAEPDLDAFPCLSLAYEALQRGGSAPAVLNAANEVAVAAFLDRKIKFLAIPEVIRQTLDEISDCPLTDLDSVLDVDRRARHYAQALVDGAP
ncbi:MAG: 1-deoxy-D-xylulose 5-phosphate reductoisomerase [Pseudomonadota bacterium]|jgi:1-deoxy-D-xylulose-5-phosphate reductoisomerase